VLVVDDLEQHDADDDGDAQHGHRDDP